MMYEMNDKKKKTSTNGAELIRQANVAFAGNERQNVETQWRELAEFVLPSQFAQFNGDNTKGIKRTRRMYDITGQISSRDLASTMHSTVTNPLSKWSKLRFRETELNDNAEANAWTQHAVTEIHNALNDSNFDNQVGECYQSLVGLGTGVLFQDEVIEEGEFQRLNFKALHLSEVAFKENHLGIVDCLYRKFRLTLKQAYQMFGDAIGEEAEQQMQTKPNDEEVFYHCIYPREKEDIKLNQFGDADAMHRPYASVYIMAKKNIVVKEDGYYNFPVYAMRWLKLPGETYGYGPGHVALADVLTLNIVMKYMLKGLAKAVDPVIFQEQNNILTGDMRPGRVVSVRNVQGIKEGVTQSRFDIGFMQAKDLRDSIKSAFYIDKLLLPPRTETGEMTAYEIEQRLNQMQVILGPPLSRLNSELLQPLVMNTLKILMKHGIIHPIPDVVIKQSQAISRNGMKAIDIDVAFVNSLARSQQMSEVRNLTSWIQEVGGIAQALQKPEAIDSVNVDAVVEKIARTRDIDEHLVLDSEEVQSMREDRQKQMALQQGLAAGEQASNIAKNIGSATGGNVQ